MFWVPTEIAVYLPNLRISIWLVFSPSWLWCEVADGKTADLPFGTRRTLRPWRLSMLLYLRANSQVFLGLAYVE